MSKRGLFGLRVYIFSGDEMSNVVIARSLRYAVEAFAKTQHYERVLWADIQRHPHKELAIGYDYDGDGDTYIDIYRFYSEPFELEKVY